MNRIVFRIALITIISKVFGFTRDLVLIYFYGANEVTDTYKLSLLIPMLILGALSTAINRSIIPILNDAEKKDSEDYFFSNYLSVIIVSILTLMVLIGVFARPLSYIVSFQINDVTRANVIFYMRLFSVIILFEVLTYSFIGYLQKNSRFYIAAAISLPLNITMILGIALFTTPSLLNISIVKITAHFVQMAFMAIPVFRSGFQYKFTFDLKDEHIKTFFVTTAPIVVSLAATQLNIIVDKNIASGFAAGSITILDLANRLKYLFFGIVVSSISSVMYSKQSKIASDNKINELIDYTRDNLSYILMVIVPITGGLIVLNQEIVRFLFLRGEFTVDKARLTGIVLMILSMSIIPETIYHIVGNMMFALKKSKIPMYITYLMIGINIVLSIILSRFFDIYGILIATLIANIVATYVFMVVIKRHFKMPDITFLKKSFLKYLSSALIMIFVLYITNTYLLTFTDLVTLLVSFVIGAIVYVLSLLFMKTPELFETYELAKDTIQNKFSR